MKSFRSIWLPIGVFVLAIGALAASVGLSVWFIVLVVRWFVEVLG